MLRFSFATSVGTVIGLAFDFQRGKRGSGARAMRQCYNSPHAAVDRSRPEVPVGLAAVTRLGSCEIAPATCPSAHRPRRVMFVARQLALPGAHVHERRRRCIGSCIYAGRRECRHDAAE